MLARAVSQVDLDDGQQWLIIKTMHNYTRQLSAGPRRHLAITLDFLLYHLLLFDYSLAAAVVICD